MGVQPKKRSNQIAVLALVVTALLLLLSRLTISWDLYKEISLTGVSQKDGAEPKAAEPKSKVAVILETRPLENLLPLILHFSSVLGPQWPIHIFTSPLNAMSLQLSAAFNRLLHAKQIQLRDLPHGLLPDFPIHEPNQRSGLLTQSWFWEQLDPAEHVLMFTSGSMVCGKADKTLDDFLEYDFIGAPMGEFLGAEKGMYGGLSLRNRGRRLEIVRNSNWEDDGSAKDNRKDSWFWKKLKTFPLLEDASRKANLPTAEMARRFSVGPVWEDEPFGYEMVHSWHEDQMNDVLKWCTEYVISMLNMTS